MIHAYNIRNTDRETEWSENKNKNSTTKDKVRLLQMTLLSSSQQLSLFVSLMKIVDFVLAADR